MSRLLPLRDLVYVLPLEDPEKIGSLYVPDEARQRVDQGIVYVRPDESELRVGDHVLFSGYTGTEIALEGVGKLIAIPEKFIDAILDHTGGDMEPIFPLSFIDKMIDRVEGNMKILRYNEDLIEEFSSRFRSFLHDHLFAELQF